MGGDTLGKTLQSPLTSHTPQQIIVTLENQSLTPDISFIVCLLFFFISRFYISRYYRYFWQHFHAFFHPWVITIYFLMIMNELWPMVCNYNLLNTIIL